MKKKNKNENIYIIILLIIVFRVLLDISYIEGIVPNFGYDGFLYKFSLDKYIESNIFLIIGIYLAPKQIAKTSDLILLMLFTITFIPLLVYYSLSDQPRLFFYSMIIQVFIVLYIGRKGALKLKIRNKKNRIDYAYWISIFFVFLTLVFLFFSIGISKMNFNLFKIYDVRAENEKEIGIGFMIYIVSWTTEVFNLFLIVYCIMNRKIIQAITFILIQISFFGFLGFKSILFFPVIILAVFLFMKWKNRYIVYLLGLIVFVGGMFFYYDYSQNSILVNLFTRRIFFVPAFLDFTYYDFFSKNEFIYLSNSILSPVVPYPYEIKNVSLLIGKYLGRPELGANTGFLGTSYMHFGYAGVLIFPIIVGFFIRITDSLSKNTPVWFTSGLVLLPFVNLFMSADLPVTLLTHGLLIGLILLFFIDDAANFRPAKKDVR